MDSQKGCQLLIVLMLCFLFDIWAQTVSVPLTTKRCYSRDSVAEFSVELTGNTFDMYWEINGTEVAQCQLVSDRSACAKTPGTAYENRIIVSSDVRKFFLNFVTHTSDQETSISVLDTGRNLLNTVPFAVEPFCPKCPQNAICPDDDTLGCQTELPFASGYAGNVTGICQEDGSFAVTGSWEAKCLTDDAPCSGCNASPSDVDPGSTLTCSCEKDGNCTAFCQNTGVWNKNCTANTTEQCTTDDITCTGCNIASSFIDLNQNLIFTCTNGTGSAVCLENGVWNETCPDATQGPGVTTFSSKIVLKNGEFAGCIIGSAVLGFVVLVSIVLSISYCCGCKGPKGLKGIFDKRTFKVK